MLLDVGQCWSGLGKIRLDVDACRVVLMWLGRVDECGWIWQKMLMMELIACGDK